jgi:thioesterase domain-containing protein
MSDFADRFAGLSGERRRLFDLLYGNAGGPGAAVPGVDGPGADAEAGAGAGAPGAGAAGAGKAGSPPPWTPLVALKPAGSRPPFFCVHAIFGSVFPYHLLAQHLDREQPFFGLQARGLDGREEPFDRIEPMAERYVAAVREAQPRGPYRLGGYSFGGLVAFEMAQQLARAGEPVSLLAVLGTGAPPFLTPATAELAELGMSYLQESLRLMVGTAVPERDRPTFEEGRRQASAKQEQWQTPLQRLAAANSLAQARYAPRPHAGKVTLFVTREQQLLCQADPTMGWWMLCAAGVEVVPIAGNHLDMFAEPQVSDLAAKLERSLGKEAEHGDR